MNLNKEAVIFDSICTVCHKMGEQRMCTTCIPYFKEIIVMAFSCNNCGYKDSEAKVGGGYTEKGKKITLKV